MYIRTNEWVVNPEDFRPQEPFDMLYFTRQEGYLRNNCKIVIIQNTHTHTKHTQDCYFSIVCNLRSFLPKHTQKNTFTSKSHFFFFENLWILLLLLHPSFFFLLLWRIIHIWPWNHICSCSCCSSPRSFAIHSLWIAQQQQQKQWRFHGRKSGMWGMVWGRRGRFLGGSRIKSLRIFA